MSIYHTTDGTHPAPASAPLRATLEACRTAVSASSAIINAVRASFVRRWTLRRLTRFSDHMLRDFGFERDWDGNILRLRDGD